MSLTDLDMRMTIVMVVFLLIATAFMGAIAATDAPDDDAHALSDQTPEYRAGDWTLDVMGDRPSRPGTDSYKETAPASYDISNTVFEGSEDQLTEGDTLALSKDPIYTHARDGNKLIAENRPVSYKNTSVVEKRDVYLKSITPSIGEYVGDGTIRVVEWVIRIAPLEGNFDYEWKPQDNGGWDSAAYLYENTRVQGVAYTNGTTVDSTFNTQKILTQIDSINNDRASITFAFGENVEGSTKDSGGFLSSIPIIGGLFDAGSDLASTVWFIGETLFWGIGTLVQVVINIVIGLGGVLLFLTETVAFMISAWGTFLQSSIPGLVKVFFMTPVTIIISLLMANVVLTVIEVSNWL